MKMKMPIHLGFLQVQRRYRGRDPQTGRPTFRTLRSADPKDNHHISFHHHTQVFSPNPTKFAMDLMREQNIQSAIDAV